MFIISPFRGVPRPTATWVATKNPTRAEHRGGSGGTPWGLVFRCPGVICEPGVHALLFPVNVRIIAKRFFCVNAEAGLPIHVRVLPDKRKLHVAVAGHLNYEERDGQQQPEPHLGRQVGRIVLPRYKTFMLRILFAYSLYLMREKSFGVHEAPKAYIQIQ